MAIVRIVAALTVMLVSTQAPAVTLSGSIPESGHLLVRSPLERNSTYLIGFDFSAPPEQLWFSAGGNFRMVTDDPAYRGGDDFGFVSFFFRDLSGSKRPNYLWFNSPANYSEYRGQYRFDYFWMSNIGEVSASFASGTVGTYSLSFVRASAAPEAASWALMIAGFGLAGTALRLRANPGSRSGPALI